MILRWYIIILFLNFHQCLFSQSSVRIAVYGGGNLDFVFNSISDYSTGITYTNYTLLGIEVIDGPDLPIDRDYITWELRVSAADANVDGNLNGTNPANTIPLSAIEVQASSIALGCPTCNLFGSPWVALIGQPATSLLVDGNQLGGADDIPPNLATPSDQINISFRCGVTTSLLGEIADFYSDDIYIDLIMSE